MATGHTRMLLLSSRGSTCTFPFIYQGASPSNAEKGSEPAWFPQHKFQLNSCLISLPKDSQSLWNEKLHKNKMEYSK